MKKPIQREFAILRLLCALQHTGNQSSWPDLRAYSRADSLLVVTRSTSDKWKSGKAYFTSAAIFGTDISEAAPDNVEGFLFLVEPRDAEGWEEEVSLPAAADYMRLCENIVMCVNAEDDLERFRGHVYFQELLYELYRARDRLKHDARTAVEQTKTFIDTHYAEAMTVEGLAAMADLSPSYYMELFKKITARSPIDYLTSVRMEAAKRLFDATQIPTHEVAQSVGYLDPFYFSRQFKRVTGISPSRYAVRSKHKIVSYHYPMTGQMLALQNIPHAAPLDREFCLFYKQRYEMQIPIHLKDPSVGINRIYNMEALHKARPDVVIAGDWLSKEEQEDLNRIATTLYVPWWDKNWREHLLIMARFLGETAQAERWLEKYNLKAAKVRSRLKERMRESSILAIHVRQGQIHRFGNRNLGSVLYEDLLLRAPGQDRVSKVYEPLSPDDLLSLNPDNLLAAIGDDSLSKELWAAICSREEWAGMSAVRNRHIYRIQPDPWFDYSAMGHERILKEILKLLS